MRLIDADELLKENFTETFVDPLDQPVFEWIIEQTPTIEAEVVKHGRWIEHERAEECVGLLISNFECSICHEWERKTSDYCPNCGAKMDLEGG